MIHEFGWAKDDWNRLAAGTIAGHIAECGAQCTGGNYTDWRAVQDYVRIGYPIIEASPDGSSPSPSTPAPAASSTAARWCRSCCMRWATRSVTSGPTAPPTSLRRRSKKWAPTACAFPACAAARPARPTRSP
jgi:hypothetical protein